MRRSSLKYLASLAFFTVGSGSLWGTDYYVRQGSGSGTPSLTCTTACQSDDPATNNCCTLINALNLANSDSFPPSLIHITNNNYQVTYTQDQNGVTMCQETGTMTIQSDVDASATVGYVGTIINFNGVNSTCNNSPPNGPVFQPQYLSSSSPGDVTLKKVVFQNASIAPNYNTINISGGSLTINGTSLNPSDPNTAFMNNNWTVEVKNSSQPKIVFGLEAGHYQQPFEGPITYITNDTTFTLTNNSSETVTLSGAIGSSGVSGSTLEVYSTSGPIAFSGGVSIGPVNTYGGTVSFTGSNQMTTLQSFDSGAISLGGTNSMTTLTVSGVLNMSGVNNIETVTASQTALLGGTNTITTLTVTGALSMDGVNSIENVTATSTASLSGSNTITTLIVNGALSMDGVNSIENVTATSTASLSGTNTITTLLNVTGTFTMRGENNIGTLTVSDKAFLDGTNSIITLNNSSDLDLQGTNTITTLNDMGTVILYDSNSLDSSAVINMGSSSSNGALSFNSGFTFLSGTITLNATDPYINSFNDLENTVQIDSEIKGTGKYNKSGSGIQILTNTFNSYTGGTNIAGGTLSISSLSQINDGTPSITMTEGTLVSTATSMTINVPISIGTFGGLATTGSLTVSGTISADSANLLIGSSQVNGASGPVILTGGNNIGAVIIGAFASNNSYPATLSVANMQQLGGIPNGLTLQGGGVFAPSSDLELVNVSNGVPIYIGTGSGTFSLSGHTLTIPGDISTATVAQGSPALNINGSGGTVVLSGDNTDFTGNLIVADATINVATTINLGSNSSLAQMGLTNSTLQITGDVDSSRGLSLSGSNTIDVASSATFNGTILAEKGSTLLKNGVGTLTILSGEAQSNTDYVLTISDGNVIGNTFSLGNATIEIASGSNLTFDQTLSGTFSGAISGDGSLSILGTGPLTFVPSSSSYSGGTFIEDTVIINDDVLGTSSSTITANGGAIESLSTFSLPQNINLSGNVTFSTNSETTLNLSGIIGGSGDLIKEGLGTLFVTQDSSYTGNTYVNEGTFLVAGNVGSSDLTVAALAALGGTGSVGNADIYGTLTGGSPDDPSGTLYVLGDLVLEEGSTFGTLASSARTSLVSVSGPVTIPSDSYYVVVPTPGTYQAFSSVVLTGSSITGRFSNVDVIGLSSSFISLELTYTDTEVILSTADRSISALASGQNAINVADALDAVIANNRANISFTLGPDGTLTPSSTPELAPLLLSLYPLKTSDTMTYALNQLHPAQMKGMAIAQESNVVMVRESLSQRMQNELDLTNCFLPDNYDVREKNCCEKNKKIMTAWVRGNGESLFQENETNFWGPLTGYRINTGVLTAGIDGRFANYFYAGALGGYTQSHLHWKDGKGKGDVRSGYAGLYFSALSEKLYANLSLIGSLSHYSANRHIQYENINLIAKNGHGGKQLLSHLDAGLNVGCYGLTFRPFESFDYITQVENGYKEYNAGSWDLGIQKNNAIMMRNELGLQFSKCYCFLEAKWTLSPKFSWVREMRVKDSGFTVNFAEAGPSFFIHGYFPSRNLFASGLTITALMLQDALKFDLSYNGEFKGRYASSNYGGQVRYSF